MSMMEVGAGRGRFIVPGNARETTEFFDTLYCLEPQDLGKLPHGSDAAQTAAAIMLAAAQEFAVVALADLFPFWRRPVSDRVALASLAFVATGIERACASERPGRERFAAINGGLELICGFAAGLDGADRRLDLAFFAQSFDAARRSAMPDESAQLMCDALMELLIDAAHLPDHGMRIALLIRTAVERLQDLVSIAAGQLVACWPNDATDRDNIFARLTKTGDGSDR
ncbi:hypothetical protein HJG53_04850 [Sphingomonas sp. ID1715]|uniref:hypothetical protein n=1 Tax=Sphingomonas sp. ID1715 TaxID=1656898 RepID=UPI001488079E|nr:hypothetical protein [Sphingomonas sp. ID1715]NNM76232.1 hypothetical protein [Sphingomonas sp. ID1715]